MASLKRAGLIAGAGIGLGFAAGAGAVHGVLAGAWPGALAGLLLTPVSAVVLALGAVAAARRSRVGTVGLALAMALVWLGLRWSAGGWMQGVGPDAALAAAPGLAALEGLPLALTLALAAVGGQDRG